MIIDLKDNIFNISNTFEERRSHSLLFSMHKPRSSSISSSKYSEDYHVHVKRDSNKMDKDESISFIGSIKVEYMSQGGQNVQVSKATNITNNMVQHVPSEDPALNSTSSNNVFNINLNYDIDQALDPEEWNSNFHTISLYGTIKHLASDIKNIKDSLQRMGKYIRGKSIDSNPNNIKNLKGVGKVVWEFLSSIYNSHWDGLYVDDTNTTFRNKVSSKFTPQVPKNLNINNKEVVKPIFIFSISPPIPAKSQNKVNELLKYFKKNTSSQQKKSYANATSPTKPSSSSAPKNIIKKTLKIKETFLNLSDKKIKQVQKVINRSNNKSKLRITMTTKSLLRKQVIILMNNDITKKFIKDSSLYIININRALKTIKSSTIANFI